MFLIWSEYVHSLVERALRLMYTVLSHRRGKAARQQPRRCELHAIAGMWFSTCYGHWRNWRSRRIIAVSACGYASILSSFPPDLTHLPPERLARHLPQLLPNLPPPNLPHQHNNLLLRPQIQLLPLLLKMRSLCLSDVDRAAEECGGWAE